MAKGTLLIVVALFVLAAGPIHAGDAPRVEVKDNWIHVDGERFFVKGVCYFEAHDVEGRCVVSSPEVLDYEFARIKAAGFNTIRTFLTPEKIELAAKHGLMIFQDADRLCFSDDYKNPARLRELLGNIDEIVGYSRKHDNILFYSIDNEPNIHALHRQGEAAAQTMWRTLAAKVKEVQPSALVAIAMMPPNAFADVSMCDVACLNLYPFNPAANSIGYAGYADWYRRRHAADKPFIFSEYGWTEDLDEFAPAMMKLLDEQLRAGASGSFFFTWRAWHKDKTADSQWWGIVPNAGLPDGHTNEPRAVFNAFREYFEAVAVEPKSRGVYAEKIPFEIYGTDRTRAVRVEVAGHTARLKRRGKYWWVGEIAFGPASFGSKAVTIKALGEDDVVLAQKEIPIQLVAEKKVLKVEIAKPEGSLTAGGTYEATVAVVDERGRKVPGQRLVFGVNQSAISEWTSESRAGVTDTNGVFRFREAGLKPGYFTLMAGVEAGPDIETRADVDMRRVGE